MRYEYLCKASAYSKKAKIHYSFVALAGCVRTRRVLQIAAQQGKAQQAVECAEGRGGGMSSKILLLSELIWIEEAKRNSNGIACASSVCTK